MLAVPFELPAFFASADFQLSAPAPLLVVDWEYPIWSTIAEPAPIGFSGFGQVISPPASPQPAIPHPIFAPPAPQPNPYPTPTTTPIPADPIARLVQRFRPLLDSAMTEKELIEQCHIHDMMTAEIGSYG